MKQISDAWKAVLEKPVLVHVATLMPDGSPQSTPVWVEMQGDSIVINSAEGRLKDKNIRRDPRVSLSVTDPDNPYKMLSVRGRVTEITKQGADDHIDKLAKKYLGKDKYPFRRSGEVRVIYRIEPTAVSGM